MKMPRIENPWLVAAGFLVTSWLTFVAIFAIACSSQPRTRTTTLPATVVASAGIRDVTSCGAVPDDGLDDRAAIQACLDSVPAAGGVLYFPSGTYDVTRSAPCKCSIDVANRSSVSIMGDGPSSVVRMIGDGSNADWYAFRVRSSTDIVFERFKIDGNVGALTNTDEQTHLINVSAHLGAVERLTIRDMVLARAAGDGLRLLGSLTNWAIDTRVSRTDFLDNDRSGVGVQRGAHGLTIDDCLFRGGHDQLLDYEPSAPGGNSRLVLTGNRFEGGDVEAYTISTAGYAPGPNGHQELVVANNIIYGGMFALNWDRAVISNNIIYGDVGDGGPLVDLRKQMSEVSIEGNVIWHTNSFPPASGPAGEALRVTHFTSGNPGPVKVEGNIFVQEAPAAIVRFESIDDLAFDDNRLTNTSGTSKPAVTIRSVTRPITHAMVVANMVRGDVTDCFALNASPNPISGVTVTANSCEGAATGVRLSGATGLYPEPLVIAANSFDVTGKAVALGSTAATYVTGGNRGGVAQYEGGGPPIVVAPDGSVYTDATSGTRWLRTGGAWQEQGGPALHE